MNFSLTANIAEGLYILDTKGRGQIVFCLQYVPGNFCSDKQLTSLMNCTKAILDWRNMFDTMNNSDGKIFY